MKISRPYKECLPSHLTQGFTKGGHEANDFGYKYGTFLVSPFNAKVLNIITAQNIDITGEELRRGYGIRLQSIEDPTLSCTYWHCQPFFPVEIGDTILQGQIVAMMGNSGFVESNGVYVEIDMRTIPPFKGTHVHWSMGQQIGDTYFSLDPSLWIDWSIPINYNVFQAASIILKKIFSFLNK